MPSADSPPRVLLVDDDFVIQQIFATVFQKAGLTLHTASSGEAAFTLFRDMGAKIEWLITDINLPGLVDGWSVADEYRKSYPKRPIIYVSTAAALNEGPAVSGSIHINKPVPLALVKLLADMIRLSVFSA